MNTLFLLTALITASFSASSAGVNQNEYSNPLPECPDSPNCARTSVRFSHSAETVAKTIPDVLKSMRAYSVSSHGNGHFSAVFRIPVFGWKDDVTIIAESAEQKSAIIHIRSASRTGYSDLGVNGRRVNRFIRWLTSDLDKLHAK